MSVKLPSTNSQIVNGQKLDYLMAYPPQALLLHLQKFDGSILTIGTDKNRNGSDDYVVAIKNVLYEDIYTGTEETIDLTTTGIGGLVDGITFTAANGRDFLIWGLANDVNTEFSGFAVTHKPYSVYTAPAAAAKGATVAFTVTNGFQFTEGARVLVRNTVGSAPQYEWNWGTITDITSNTSISIQMDNDGNYGVALTAVTGGEILQWDMFRPWVVGATQELYSDNYRLVGELFTSTSGGVTGAFRIDEEFRPLNDDYQVRTAVTSGNNQVIDLARYIPLWSRGAYLRVIGTSSAVNDQLRVKRLFLIIYMQLVSQVANRQNQASSFCLLQKDAQTLLDVSSANYGTVGIRVINYYVPGGMRQ